MEQRSSCLELWGGVECTVNRVRDLYMDQLDRTGHTRRLSDFEQFQSLGISALRQCVPWERIAPQGIQFADWQWSDAALNSLKRLSIRPIIGLMHHGSGPRSTGLLDPEFPEQLAAYARAVAQRYPWVEDYTPINEPLTTARFSALYGHWYPHARDEHSFARALLNQCRAIILSMRAIREVNPLARLIQTEDMGKVFSTPKLEYQAAFENERRWSTFDLLCGRVNRTHRMWGHFTWAGIDESLLQWFLDNPCAPDVLGINHYLTGDRFLDEDLERYPSNSHGGNGRHRYADVEACRVQQTGTPDAHRLIMETWERYRLPVAVTECHNGCTREEQLRWFLGVWRGAQQSLMEGAEVLAVTAWSLLGAFDWNSLVTRDEGHYESGVFDIRSGTPRPTALAGMIRSLAAGKTPDHPILQVPGWWRRPGRFIHNFCRDEHGRMQPAPQSRGVEMFADIRPVLIGGGFGTLGSAFARLCEVRGIPYRQLSREEFDIADRQSVREIIQQFNPWAIINAAGYSRVDDAETDRSCCYRDNTEGPSILADECHDRGIQLVTFSSDQVFGGTGQRPYLETDPVNPINYYGYTKAEAEKIVLNTMPTALVVRAGALFGPWNPHNFIAVALRELQAERRFRAAADTMISPTYIPDLVNACLDLLVDGESGIWHLANQNAISWAGLAERVADIVGVSSRSLEKSAIEEMQYAARRPAFSVLGSAKALLLPPLEDALRRFVDHCEFRQALAENNLAAEHAGTDRAQQEDSYAASF
jgi:dTDP-4-dehydrorhamnose reductase